MDKMGELRRTHYNEDTVGEKYGAEVTVAGFVARVRDIGNLIFCDMRDFTGILQLAFDDTTKRDVFEKAKHLAAESAIMAKGLIRERSSKNPEMLTGDIELFVTDLRVLSVSATPPFEIRDDVSVKESLALKYRYLDLRRPSLNGALVMRSKIVKKVRDFFDENNFIEVETPMLVRSTPEGARDYIVPSRVHPGRVFALPQSPQLFKQLLILSGVDRYIQIARCFRDEDLRADRQPEFSQIDVEIAFADVNDVLELNERFIKRLFKDILDYEITLPLKRMTYEEAMTRFGSDKPDLRYEMEIVDVTDIVKNCTFEIFSGAVSQGGSVRAVTIKNQAEKLTRKEIDKLTETVKVFGAKGLAYSRLLSEGASSSYEKFLNEEEIEGIRAKCEAAENDAIFIVADKKDSVVLSSLGALRQELAKQFNLIDEKVFNVSWITEFPLFEYSEEDDRYYAVHHPFTSPMDEDMDKIESDPLNCRAKAYDMIINGNEVGGGSIRISNPELQRRMFKALSFTDEEMKAQFGFLIEAYTFGAPPHGGIAFGLDRLVMLLLKRNSIREVIAFPKVQSSADLMTGAPSVAGEKQLKELCMKFEIPDGE